MSYRDVASKQVLIWACTAVGARMPVAMAPLALVFLVRERPGGYSLGAMLAAAYVIGEIVGAPVLGMRLRHERARLHLAAGLACGAVGFAGLGAIPGAHPAVLGGFALVAGAAPAAATGGLRTLLTTLVPERSAAQALSVESMLTAGVWAASPAAVAGLALGVAPRVPLLLAAALMASSVAGLWFLPAAWGADHHGGGGARLRVLAGAWPVYVTGAASLALLGLAELVLPALLEQRGVGVGWSGPLLTGMAVGGGLGGFVYGLRTWPGLLRTRSMVLMVGTSVCVTLAALIPGAVGIAAALAVGGTLQTGAMLTRNLSLREALPAGALAAGYSVMYAAAGAGYAATGSLAGALLQVVAPSTAMLAGVVLTLALTVLGWWGEIRHADRSAQGADPAVAFAAPAGSVAPARSAAPDGSDGSGGFEGSAASAASAGSAGSVAPVDGRADSRAAESRAVGSGSEGAAVRGRGDAEGRL
ncbi:MFS transporter [Streptomyces soliscabiei]|uniref:MFS transporter n=1 Tax=Streptomyces soliscabiei TaxID=588897 RepID=UPI0029A8BE9F|nr:MFS transporter [Streptomyces sp. NY05-11A]MDX2678903.1 MFS transporter [Streptomyces sp. NY05-11A]